MPSLQLVTKDKLLTSSMRFSRQIIATGMRSFSQKAPTSAAAAATAPQDPLAKVKGLTTDCVASPSGSVGPGAKTDGAYKVPEYFCFNTFSYHHAEVEMQKYRIPQPDAHRQK